MCPNRLDPAGETPTPYRPNADVAGKLAATVADTGGRLDLTHKGDRRAAVDWLRDAIEGPLATGHGVRR